MILKLGMQHWALKLYNVYINGDTGLTLSYFTARSNLVAGTFECEKLLPSRHDEIKKVIVINCNLITFSKIIECNCN